MRIWTPYPKIPADTLVQDIPELDNGHRGNVREIQSGGGTTGDAAEDVPDEGAEQNQHVPVQTQLQIVPSVHQNFVRIGYHGFEGGVEDNSM